MATTTTTTTTASEVERLTQQVGRLQQQVDDLKRELERARRPSLSDDCRFPLSKDEYRRYGRQMIMPEIGLQGQLSLRSASVLVVGLGGLGCPAASYLAGAGVGTLGLVDGDTVELSNLHRQILHTTGRVGQYKVHSAVEALRQYVRVESVNFHGLVALTGRSRLNPMVQYRAYPAHLSSRTAVSIFDAYDVILDCTDHPTSRYLVSDAAVLTGKPLVSASALRTEGQLMLLNHSPKGREPVQRGPCYRCVFPRPPPADTVVSCGEGGILGPVVGTMGVLMALEAIKVVTANTSTEDTRPSMLLFSAFTYPPFRSVKLRGKRQNCIACSVSPSISKASLASGSVDYVQFCGVATPVNVLSGDERISAAELHTRWQMPDEQPALVDVRDRVQYEICHLPGSINLPFSVVQGLPDRAFSAADEPTSGGGADELRPYLGSIPESRPICVICRMGNDSQLAVRKLKGFGYDRGGQRWIGDVRGGFDDWRRTVDPQWPEY